MRELPDPGQYFERHLNEAAARYIIGLQRAGLTPNSTLTNALIERAIEAGKVGYIREAIRVRDHNIEVIVRNHKKHMSQLKWEGAYLRMRVCPPLVVIFGLLAWYSFRHADGFMLGVVYVVGSLAFLALLVLGAIFDRPR